MGSCKHYMYYLENITCECIILMCKQLYTCKCIFQKLPIFKGKLVVNLLNEKKSHTNKVLYSYIYIIIRRNIPSVGGWTPDNNLILCDCTLSLSAIQYIRAGISITVELIDKIVGGSSFSLLKSL